MNTLSGYLFSKLMNIGTRSEGPQYFLQQFDYKEIVVIKQAEPWKEDPILHPLLNKKVTVEGELTSDGLIYSAIGAYVSEDK